MGLCGAGCASWFRGIQPDAHRRRTRDSVPEYGDRMEARRPTAPPRGEYDVGR